MQHWHELTKVLTSELELLGRAVAVGERKRQALTNNDVRQLETLLAEEEAVASQLQAAEYELTRVVGTLAGEYQAANLAELLALPACPNQAELQPLYERLVIQLASLQQLNEQNRLLIEQALAYIDFSLKVLVNSQNDPAYNQSGQARQQDKPRLLDRKM